MTTRRTQIPKVTLWPNGQESSRIDIGGWCQAFQCSKAITGPEGNWQATFLPRHDDTLQMASASFLPDLYHRCRPNGLISIGMDEPGGIMMGLISNIKRTRVRKGGTVRQGFTLTGQDMGKVLARDNIVRASLNVKDFQEFLTRIEPVVGPDHAILSALPGVHGPQGQDGAPVFVGKGPQEILEWLLNTSPGMQVPLLGMAGGTGRPGEFIKTDGSVTIWNDSRIYSENPHTYQGTVWGFIRSLLDEDFYEVWVDTVPNGKAIPEVRLIIRPKPFDEPALNFLPVRDQPGTDWLDLRTLIDGKTNHDIALRDCWSEDLSHGDEDVYAYYMVTSQHEVLGNANLLAAGLFYPAVDTYALKTTGLRSYEANLSLLGSDTAAQQEGRKWTRSGKDIASETVEFRNRLVNWYRLNRWFESGQITVRGQDRFRVGDPIRLPWLKPVYGEELGMRFYTAGVTHSWAVGGPYTTNLTITRGHNLGVIRAAKAEIAADGAKYGFTDPIHLAEASE